MSIPGIAIVDNEFLALIPSEEALKDVIVPLVRLRDLPSFLGRHSRLHSSTNLFNREKTTRNESQSAIQMEARMLQSLGEHQSPRREHGSFCIPNGRLVQIYATGKERTYLMVRGEHCLQLSSTCGYWIGDFCSVGGYQQALWLPVITVDMPKWSLDLAKRILSQMLCQCVLTDSVDVSLSCDALVEKTTTPIGDCCPNIVLCNISEIPDIMEPMQLITPEDRREHEPHAKRNGRQSAWMKTMTRALESRLIKERKEYDKRVHSEQVKRLLLGKNRKALQELLNPKGTSIQPVQLRYRTLPSGSGSTTIFMEVDVVTSSAGETICGLHLSCSPVVVSKSNAVSVRTHSGIVPEPQHEVCMTIITIVEVNGIDFSERSDECTLDLIIEAHWTTNKGAPVDDPRNELTRRASNVAILQLPLEPLLLIQKEWTCIDYHTALARKGKPLVPTAVYECRKPHRLQVDVSYCSCDWNWNEWAESLDKMLSGTGHHIDVCNHVESGVTLSIILFSFPENDLPGRLLTYTFVHRFACHSRVVFLLSSLQVLLLS